MTKTVSTPLCGDFIASTLKQSPLARQWRERAHLLETKDLSLDEISIELALTHYLKEGRAHHLPPLSVLSDRTIITLFYENSTRTRSSFDLAARKLSATTLNLDVRTSSVSKGESLEDTALNLHAMGADAVIMRHSQSGAPVELAQKMSGKLSVINAGDGSKAHPSQGLLDLYTILESLGHLPKLDDGKVLHPVNDDTLRGKKIAIVGDILHSRVARSNLWLLQALGAKVHFAGPKALLPEDFPVDEPAIELHDTLEPAIADADFIMALRIQLERQEEALISPEAYIAGYQVNHKTIAKARPAVKILHPGPINRGIELTDALADDHERSLVLRQVENGILTRMSTLALILGGHH
jgi:aspartate carbamoyltransferase catalytic subunit